MLQSWQKRGWISVQLEPHVPQDEAGDTDRKQPFLKH